MTGEEFKNACNWIEERIEEYDCQDSLAHRTAVIAGFFSKNSDKMFSGEQVSKILALRF